MVSIVIPSKTERFLKHTIEDILEKATGDVEVFPVLNGYHLQENEMVKDDRVTYLHLPKSKNTTKRQSVNLGVKKAKGEYVMSVDAHCMFDKGFDQVLVDNHQPDWVQIPRRNRLDAENWCLQKQSDNRPPIDYEYIIFRSLIKDRSIHGFKWDERTLSESHIPIANTIEFQGSCWFMTKNWFEKMGFMQVEGYRGWGQEAEEIGFTTWLNGGKVKTNKLTWYAHLHKGKKYGRMYWMSRHESRLSYDYSFKKWLIDNKEFFISLVEMFPRMPGWTDDWKDQIWKL
jgi:glycosyltransferase involved in cell wall biosynthesis